MTPEGKILRSICRYLDGLSGVFYIKVRQGDYGTRGAPDIIGCIRGRFFGFEVKAAKAKPTPLQRYTLSLIDKAGGIGLVVSSAEEVKNILIRGIG